MLIYPEGTRYSPKKQARAVEKIREKGWDDLADMAEQYHSLLPPRVSGPLALIEAAPQLDVVVLEHSGFEGVDSFHRFWSGGLIGRTVRFASAGFLLPRFHPHSVNDGCSNNG